jgi:phthalate 4,5-cis-dihydrodiol dehydrogenase
MSVARAIQLGAIGLGRGFMLTLPALTATTDIKLRAAFDIRPEARKKFAEEFAAKTYDSLDGVLADPEVEAVYIATPHELHAAHVISAARAGKHILVEKPMSTNIADARAMIAAARSAGVVLVIGPSHGFDLPIQRAAEFIAARRFGSLRMITTLNFTDFVYRPRRPEELDPAQGGGVVYSQAAHQFDVVRGLVDRRIIEVTAVSGNWDPARPGDGAYTAFARFEDGIAASLTYSGYAHYDSDELMDWVSELGRKKDPSVYGQARKQLAGISASAEAQAKVRRTFAGDATAGVAPPATHNEHFGFLLASCERADLKVMADGIWIFGDGAREFIPIPAPPIPRIGAISEFVDAVRGVRPPKHDGQWGLETMLCCVALVRSSAEARSFRLCELA